MSIGSKKDKILALLNMLLLVLFISFVAFFFLGSDDSVLDEKIENNQVSFYSLSDAPKHTMLKNELVIPKVKDEEKVNKKLEIKEVEDPELSYAIKLFSSSVNSKLGTVFNKPFNYNPDNYCVLEVLMKSDHYKVVSCEADAIFKREIELGIERMIPFNRKVYNNINLKDKKVKIKLIMN